MRSNVKVVILRNGFVLGCLALPGFGCAADSSTPINSVAADKKLVDLNASEMQGVCDWSQQIAREKFAAAPSMGRCGNSQLSITGCMTVQAGCEATLAQYKVCIPNFIGRIADDPCLVFSLSSQAEVNMFIEETPGCAGLGPCGFETN